MTRLAAAVAALAILTACQNESHPAFSPAPSPTPHAAPTKAILQPADAPAGLTVCQGSGPLDVYLSVLTISNPAAASRLTDDWLQLLTDGATDGAISVYVASATECSAELGVTPSGRAVTTVVVQFAEEGQADRAWEAGIFGFVPPATGEVAPGVTRGTSTGLGASSFTYVGPAVRLASWRRSVYVALVIASNLDIATFKAVTAAVDPHLN